MLQSLLNEFWIFYGMKLWRTKYPGLFRNNCIQIQSQLWHDNNNKLEMELNIDDHVVTV